MQNTNADKSQGVNTHCLNGLIPYFLGSFRRKQGVLKLQILIKLFCSIFGSSNAFCFCERRLQMLKIMSEIW